MTIIGYLRVSTADQEYGIEAQRSVISAEAERRGWDIQWFEDAGRSGKNLKRPGMVSLLARLRPGDVVVVAKLDRLTRSPKDFHTLLEIAAKERWSIVALDLALDMTTPVGELVAGIMVAVGQWERRMIGVRTREGLAEAKARGVRLGSPVLLDAAIESRIVQERAEGSTLAAIADGLNAESIPPAGRGKQWYPSSVRAVLNRVEVSV
jgi:DNA invertase Pin-like site-specific DNA recombinase